MHLTRSSSILTLVLLVLLAACGGSAVPSTVAEGAPDAGDVGTGDGDTGAGDTNACLNTNEEVSAAFGVTVTEQENASVGDGSASCIYYVDREAFEVPYTIGLSAAGGAAQQVFDAFKADDASEPAAGIGDEAIWYAGGLVIRKGDRVLSIGSLTAMDEAELRTILTDLGRKAVDRL